MQNTNEAQATQQAPIQLKDGNWTPEAEKELQARYSGNQDNDQLSKMVAGKSGAAVRSKLVSLGVYEKNEPRSVGGGSGTRKIQVVSGIETMLSMPKGSLSSLEKSRKDELEALAEALVKTSDRKEADSQ